MSKEQGRLALVSLLIGWKKVMFVVIGWNMLRQFFQPINNGSGSNINVKSILIAGEFGPKSIERSLLTFFAHKLKSNYNIQQRNKSAL